MSKTKINRRTFIKTASAASIAPMILPSGVLAQNGRPGANDKLVIGQIATGGQGRAHANFLAGRDDVQVAAVCDVDEKHRQMGIDFTGGKAEGYNDYRKLLERKDLDAVLIAAPDHWHGIMAVDAANAGLDVYVEKPASKTIEEGRAMLEAARRNKIVMQVGSQGRSTPAAIASCNYIRNGQIGDVKKVVCWHYDNPVGGDLTKTGPAPKGLDWNMWLGPARWAPYNPDRVHFNFRWMLDFGGGQIRDRGAHVLSVLSWCLGLDEKSPVRVHATGSAPETGLWDCPTNFRVEITYDDPELTVIWEQPGIVPDKSSHNLPAGFHDQFGATYYGSKGNLVIGGGDGGCFAEKQAEEYTPPSNGYNAFKSPGHHQNWFDCIKSREKPIMDIAAGHQVGALCILANLSYRLGRPIEWDGKNERIKNDEDANRLLGSPGRGEFRLNA